MIIPHKNFKKLYCNHSQMFVSWEYGISLNEYVYALKQSLNIFYVQTSLRF